MHRWKIHKKQYWLCQACMKKLTQVIMLGSWKWLYEVHDQHVHCDRCRCSDEVVVKYGPFRYLYRFFVQDCARFLRLMQRRHS